MGIGMTIICSADEEKLQKMKKGMPDAIEIGRVVKANGSERVIIK
jgi:hypothetical protein